MPDSSRQEIKLFYCYAREDKSLRDELEKHLGILKRLYALRNWHDREILPGQEWEHAIEDSLGYVLSHCLVFSSTIHYNLYIARLLALYRIPLVEAQTSSPLENRVQQLTHLTLLTHL